MPTVASPDAAAVRVTNQLHQDPLAKIFFFLSRYEEYQAFSPDRFGRFSAEISVAGKGGFLERPIVNELLVWLRGELAALFPGVLDGTPRRAVFHPTYDVDLPWAFLHRGVRGMAAGVRDLLTGHPGRAALRANVLAGRAADPYDTFNWLRSLHRAQGVRPRVFWLLANRRSREDTNPSPSLPAYEKLIREVSTWADIGIHPSFRSSEQNALIEEEKKQLKEISGLPITHSRQHFLRFTLPETYRALLRSGITNDHSMGFADRIGWRAGTNLPFRWYDLEQEKVTALWVHPFAAMDVTLLNYMQLSAREVPPLLQSLYEALEPLGGPFSLLWHNSSFADAYGWRGWAEMYQGVNERMG